jgi:rod shape-determining protein MreC
MLLTVLTVIALALITVDVRSDGDGPLASVRSGIQLVFAGAQQAVGVAVRPLGSIGRSLSEIRDVRAENARLRTELRELHEPRRVVEDLERENEELRALLRLRDELEQRDDAFDLLGARVVGFAPSDFEWSVTIDAGSRDGVSEEMAVVAAEGLVGRVVWVGPTTARVLLAADPSFSVAVRLARTGTQGYVDGGGSDPFRLRLLEPRADVQPGDAVVTSSYRKARYPTGLAVGQVEDVGEETGILERQVIVRPFVDFTSLDHVLVVMSAPPPGSEAEEADVAAAGRGGAERVR